MGVDGCGEVGGVGVGVANWAPLDGSQSPTWMTFAFCKTIDTPKAVNSPVVASAYLTGRNATRSRESDAIIQAPTAPRIMISGLRLAEMKQNLYYLIEHIIKTV